MRSRLWFAAVTAIAAMTAPNLSAQDQGVASSGGLVAGDYLRVGAGIGTPVNPQGSLRDWQRGTSFGVMWENWQPGPTGGPSRVSFGLGGAYTRLSLDETQFRSIFTPQSGGNVRSASGNAGILELNSTIRVRLPAPYVVPALSLGFGFINWAPGAISYTTSGGATGTAKQEHRAGAELALGGSLDAPLFDRYALFGEAQYVYGFTSFGSGFASASGTCLANNCEALKNTTIAVIRAGLRVRTGR